MRRSVLAAWIRVFTLVFFGGILGGRRDPRKRQTGGLDRNLEGKGLGDGFVFPLPKKLFFSKFYSSSLCFFHVYKPSPSQNPMLCILSQPTSKTCRTFGE